MRRYALSVFVWTMASLIGLIELTHQLVCCLQHEIASKDPFPDEHRCSHLLQKHHEALEKYREHVAKDYWTRGYINCMKRLSIALDRVYTNALAQHSGEWSANDRQQFGEYVLCARNLTIPLIAKLLLSCVCHIMMSRQRRPELRSRVMWGTWLREMARSTGPSSCGSASLCIRQTSTCGTSQR